MPFGLRRCRSLRLAWIITVGRLGRINADTRKRIRAQKNGTTQETTTRSFGQCGHGKWKACHCRFRRRDAKLFGTIDNNVFTILPGPFGTSFNVVRIIGVGNSEVRVNVTNNTVSHAGSSEAIAVRAQEGSPLVDVTITGNSVNMTSTVSPNNGIEIEAGRFTTDGLAVCVD